MSADAVACRERPCQHINFTSLRITRIFRIIGIEIKIQRLLIRQYQVVVRVYIRLLPEVLVLGAVECQAQIRDWLVCKTSESCSVKFRPAI
ncbi:hypothetical protein D3C78_1577220 [compost metagenome]